jgi:hypothetical protein
MSLCDDNYIYSGGYTRFASIPEGRHRQKNDRSSLAQYPFLVEDIARPRRGNLSGSTLSSELAHNLHVARHFRREFALLPTLVVAVDPVFSCKSK